MVALAVTRALSLVQVWSRPRTLSCAAERPGLAFARLHPRHPPEIDRGHHLRLDDGHCLQNRREPAIKQNEEQPVAIREPDTPAHLALKNGNLVPERGILCLKLGLRLGWQHQQSQRKTSSAIIVASRYAIPSLDQYGSGFRYPQAAHGTLSSAACIWIGTIAAEVSRRA